MGEPHTAVFGIFENLSTEHGVTLAGRFMKGNTISLSAYKHITSNTVDNLSEYAGKHDIHIYHLEPNFIFQSKVLRSLLAEANNTFINIQESSKDRNQISVLKYSRAYRSIIRSCLQKLQDNKMNIEMQSDLRINHYVTIFYSVECLWHLIEILFIDPSTTNVIVPHLLEWVRFHFPTQERMATDLLLMGKQAANNQYFWPTVKGLVLQGQVDAARALLRLHPLIDSSGFKMAEHVLKMMPSLSCNGGFSIQHFYTNWQYWATDTKRKLTANVFAMDPDLEEIIKIISGDETIWNKQIKQSAYWYEFYPGYLFYTHPTCNRFELITLSKSWINKWNFEKEYPNCNHLNYLDNAILSLMENNLLKVIHSIQILCDNQWFAAHITDLLYQCGQLDSSIEQISENKDLRKTLLFEFGLCLMAKESFWQLGIEYLEQCSKKGRDTIKLFFTKIPIRNDKQALKIINMCRRKGLSSLEQEICKVQSKKSFQDKRFGNALEWAIRSKDAVCVTSIADFFLKHYSKTGNLICSDIILNIGAKMFISPRLVFLVKYFDFYHLYRKRDFLPAAELLVNLLDSKLTPEYFWPSILIDTIPLLESKDPKILAQETCAILGHLESKMIPLVKKEKQKLKTASNESAFLLMDYRIENVEEIMNLLRLACSRNLSRAIIIENAII